MKALKNKELVKLSSDYYKTYYSGVTLNWKNLSKDVLNVEKAIERIAQIEKAIGIIKGKKLSFPCQTILFSAKRNESVATK